jgi:proline-rich protein PRCC
VNYGSYESGADQSVAQNVGGDGVSYGGYESYGGYGDSGQYGSNWDDRSVAAVAETGSGGAAESALRMMGKRRRNEIPTEIIEVKQDELIKNRPREDQVKSTGIAFGPAYQVLHLLLFVYVRGSFSLFVEDDFTCVEILICGLFVVGELM